MDKQIIMPTVPEMGMISFLSKEYDVLTDELIQRWLFQLYNDHLIDPEYLFVSNQGRQDIRKVLQGAPYSYRWQHAGEEWTVVDDLISRYPNHSTGTALHVVVLPTLPEHTLLVGNLVLPKPLKMPRFP